MFEWHEGLEIPELWGACVLFYLDICKINHNSDLQLSNIIHAYQKTSNNNCSTMMYKIYNKHIRGFINSNRFVNRRSDGKLVLWGTSYYYWETWFSIMTQYTAYCIYLLHRLSFIDLRHLITTLVFSFLSFVFCVVFCIPLFVLLFLFLGMLLYVSPTIYGIW